MTTFQHINNIIINHNYKLQSDWISAALLALTMGLITKQYLSCRSNWSVGVIIHITAVIGAKVLFRFSCLHLWCLYYDVYKNTLEISWQCLAVVLSQILFPLLYSGTPPYDHPVYKTTSLLQPYSFKPNVKTIESFYYFEDPVNATTSLLWPGFYGPTVVALTGFNLL